MQTVSLDRFAQGAVDAQDRPTRYRGPYSDPYDDGDWVELTEEDKRRRARFDLDEEEENNVTS